MFIGARKCSIISLMRIRDGAGASQFSQASPSIRLNSPPLSVTIVQPSANAWAAMRRSWRRSVDRSSPARTDRGIGDVGRRSKSRTSSLASASSPGRNRGPLLGHAVPELLDDDAGADLGVAHLPNASGNAAFRMPDEIGDDIRIQQVAHQSSTGSGGDPGSGETPHPAAPAYRAMPAEIPAARAR